MTNCYIISLFCILAVVVGNHCDPETFLVVQAAKCNLWPTSIPTVRPSNGNINQMEELQTMLF